MDLKGYHFFPLHQSINQSKHGKQPISCSWDFCYFLPSPHCPSIGTGKLRKTTKKKNKIKKKGFRIPERPGGVSEEKQQYLEINSSIAHCPWQADIFWTPANRAINNHTQTSQAPISFSEWVWGGGGGGGGDKRDASVARGLEGVCTGVGAWKEGGDEKNSGCSSSDWGAGGGASSMRSLGDNSARTLLIIFLVRLTSAFLCARWRALSFMSSRSSLLSSLSGSASAGTVGATLICSPSPCTTPSISPGSSIALLHFPH